MDLIILIGVGVWLISALFAGNLATRRNRSSVFWFVLGCFLGPFTWSILSRLPKFEEKLSTVTPTETLLGIISSDYQNAETSIRDLLSNTDPKEIIGVEYRNRKTDVIIAAIYYTGDLPEYVIGFNSAGKITGKGFYNPDGSLDRIHLIDPQTNQIIETQLWESGIKTQAKFYNAKGAIIKHAFYRPDGTREKEDLIAENKITRTNFYNFTGKQIIEST